MGDGVGVYNVSPLIGEIESAQKTIACKVDLTGRKNYFSFITTWKRRESYAFEHLICASHCVGSSQIPNNR